MTPQEAGVARNENCGTNLKTYRYVKPQIIYLFQHSRTVHISFQRSVHNVIPSTFTDEREESKKPTEAGVAKCRRPVEFRDWSRGGTVERLLVGLRVTE